MKNKNIIGMIGLGVILITVGIYLIKNLTEKSIHKKENHNQSTGGVVNVDEVVNDPDHYKGFLGVEGRVIKIDESKDIFLLGCEDACMFMPVKYTGQMPEMGKEIIVYGEIKKQEDGKYAFEGKETKTK